MRKNLLWNFCLVTAVATGSSVAQVWTAEVLPDNSGTFPPAARALGVSSGGVVGASTGSAGYLWTLNSSGQWVAFRNGSSRFTAISGDRIVGGTSPNTWLTTDPSGVGSILPIPSNVSGPTLTSAVKADVIVGNTSVSGLTPNARGIVWRQNSSQVYEYTLLPTIGTRTPLVYGTNGTSHVGEVADTFGDTVSKAVYWSSDTSVSFLPEPAGVSNATDSAALAIDGNSIVGFVSVENNQGLTVEVAALWTSPSSDPIFLTNSNSVPEDTEARATAVSNGVQVGFSNDNADQEYHAMIWAAGSSSVPIATTDLHLFLDSQEYRYSQATGVWVVPGDPGRVVVSGFAGTRSGSTIHPVVWVREFDCNCPANFYEPYLGECILNFFDVSAFIAKFNSQDPAADLFPVGSPDGIWNFFDISQFLSYFNTGCSPE